MRKSVSGISAISVFSLRSAVFISSQSENLLDFGEIPSFLASLYLLHSVSNQLANLKMLSLPRLHQDDKVSGQFTIPISCNVGSF